MPGSASFSAHHGSLLISLVVILFALLLVATPPLAVLSLSRDAPAAPAVKTQVTVSQFA